MTDEEARRLEHALARLRPMLKGAERFTSEVVEPPKPGSAIAEAYKSGQRDPFDLAGSVLFAAEDHLRTILSLVEKAPMPCFSPFTLLRAAGEAVVRAKYLLDPAISPAQRLGRALNVRLDNVRESEKAVADAERAGRLVREDPDHLERRTALLESHAVEAGLTVHHENRKDGTPGKITGFGEVMKTEWDLFNELLPVGSATYRFLSGYVHSMPWVQFQGHRAQPSDDPGAVLVPTDLNVKLFVAVLTAMMELYDEAREHWVVLAGYPPVVWQLAIGEQ